jgi:hypothetical protein
MIEEKVPAEWKTNGRVLIYITTRATNYSVTFPQEYHYYVQDTKYQPQFSTVHE